MKLVYADVEREIDAFVHDLRSFASPASSWILFKLKSSVMSAQQAVKAGDQFRWEFGCPDESSFLTTVASEDDIEEKGAILSFCFWFDCVQGERIKNRISEFRIKSGSILFLIKNADDECLHEFCMDFQDGSGPGFQRHSQTKGNFENSSKFIEVPRFPSLVAFPTDAVSIIMHEVFPQSWPKHLAASKRAQLHGGEQRKRILKLLESWSEVISDSLDPVGSIRSARSS